MRQLKIVVAGTAASGKTTMAVMLRGFFHMHGLDVTIEEQFGEEHHADYYHPDAVREREEALLDKIKRGDISLKIQTLQLRRDGELPAPK